MTYPAPPTLQLCTGCGLYEGHYGNMSFLLVRILSVTTMMSLVVPNGALGGLLIILHSLGLPTTNVGLLLAVEWIA